MSLKEQYRAGRLPQLAPDAMDEGTRALHDQMDADVKKSLQGFTSHDEDGALIGPFPAMLHHPELGGPLWAYTQAVSGFGALPPRVREVVILTTGARMKAAYELYAHTRVGRRKGLSEEQVRGLARGEVVDGLDEQEETARAVTAALTAGGPLEQGLYQRALSALGARGVAELTQLSGLYLSVSMLLNVYDVPVPEGEPEIG